MKEQAEKVVSAFRKYHCLHRNVIDSRFREKGICMGQPPILKFLSENSDATQKEIADALHISAPSVATSLKRMEKAGLVVRFESKTDARRNNLRLTKKGRELSDYADAIFLRVDDAVFSGFSEEELLTLLSFFERMNTNLQSLKEEHNA